MKILMIGCTHQEEGKPNLLHGSLPKSDILIHTGDFNLLDLKQLNYIDEWLGSQPAKYKIWIGGNHDFLLQKKGKEFIKSQLNFSIYLEDETIVIDGIKFYGSPWTPKFGDWAYMIDDLGLEEKVSLIPNDTDILISHGPVYGILDQVHKANGDISHSVGNIPMRDAVKKRIKPKLMVCSHIHEAYGYYYDYQTHYFNVSFLDKYYLPTNKPVLIELKEDLKILSIGQI